MVLTPALNKSFRFQSDWPYNNSQTYLIDSIIKDIKNDKEKSITKSDKEYIIMSKVNYPNNRELVKQIVTIDKDLNIKEVKVVNENDIEKMKMTFKAISINDSIKDEEFDVNKMMMSFENNCNDCEVVTSKLEDILYPLYIPTGTVLSSEEKLEKENGERVIMTFEGEKPFLLVEETASIGKDFSIVPTYGEPYLLLDTVGALTDSSLTWSSNGVDYYLVSDVMSQDELVEIARSINVVPNAK